MSHLQAVPFVLNALQMKSNLRAPTVRKSLHHWSANWTLIRKMIIAQCVCSFSLHNGTTILFLYHSPLTIYTLQFVCMQNVNTPEIRLKLVSEKKTHLSHHNWHKINCLTFLPDESLLKRICFRKFPFHKRSMMEKIIKWTVVNLFFFFSPTILEGCILALMCVCASIMQLSWKYLWKKKHFRPCPHYSWYNKK